MDIPTETRQDRPGAEGVPLGWTLRRSGLTIDLEDQAAVLAVAAGLGDRHHVEAGVWQPQVRQAQGAIAVSLHPAAVVLRDVAGDPRLPGADAAAHGPRHECPEDGRRPRAGHVYGEQHVVLHRPREAPLRTVDGDGRRWGEGRQVSRQVCHSNY